MCCGETVEDFRLYIAGALRNIQEARRAWETANDVTLPAWTEVLTERAFQRRIGGASKASTLAVAVVLFALAAPTTVLPALGSLGIVSAALVALVAYDASRDATTRDAVRHDEDDDAPDQPAAAQATNGLAPH